MKTIAFSNCSLHKRSGTETFLLDVTTALSRRGYKCGVFTPRKGGMAEEFVRHGVPVWDKLDEMTLRPDVLHCQHNLEAIRLCHRFPETPALFMVHSYSSWTDETPPLPQVRCVATVSEYIRERVVRDTGLPVDQIPLIFNGVDLNRFRPRGKLPAEPRNLVLFCSNVVGSAHVDLVERVARKMGLVLEKIGPPFGSLVAAPEEVLGNFDLVLSVGRCAIEALCVGCAVIVIGSQGVGDLVTLGNFSKFRRRNFGLSLLERPLEESVLQQAILSYNADEAFEVGSIARERCDIERTVDDLLALYETLSERPGLSAPQEKWVDPAFLVRCIERLWHDEFALRRWAEDLDCARRRHEQIMQDMDCARRRHEEIVQDLDCARRRHEQIMQDMDCARRRHEEIMQDLAKQVKEHQCACAEHRTALNTERRRILDLETEIKASEEVIQSLKKEIHRLEIDSSLRGFLSKKFRSLKSRKRQTPHSSPERDHS
jgi:hypothetical protein